jgi:hypothetical protein
MQYPILNLTFEQLEAPARHTEQVTICPLLVWRGGRVMRDGPKHVGDSDACLDGTPLDVVSLTNPLRLNAEGS